MSYEQPRLFDPGPVTNPQPREEFSADHRPVQRLLKVDPPSDGEMRRGFDDHLSHARRVVSTRRPAISVENALVPGVISSRQFKNMHETGHSGAGDSRHARENIEAHHWDYQTVGQGPVYGYMRESVHPGALTHNDYMAAYSYGTNVFNLRPDRVMRHTTVTYGDSMGGDPTQVSETAHDVAQGTPRSPGNFIGLENQYTRQHPTYIEAQFHEPVHLSDVESVDAYPPETQLIPPERRLEGSEIPFTVHKPLGRTTQGVMFHRGPRGRETVSNGMDAAGDPYPYNDGVTHYRPSAVNYTGRVGATHHLRPLSGTDEFWQPTGRPRRFDPGGF